MSMKVIGTVRGVLLRGEGPQYRWHCRACRLWGVQGQRKHEAKAGAIEHANTVHGGWAPGRLPAGAPVPAGTGIEP